MFLKSINYLLFIIACVFLFSVTNFVACLFITWFVKLPGVSQIVVFGIAASSCWLISAGFTAVLAGMGRRLNIHRSFVRPFLFILFLLLFGLLLFEVCKNAEPRDIPHAATFLALFILIAEIALYPLFVLSRHINIGHKKTGPQE